MRELISEMKRFGWLTLFGLVIAISFGSAKAQEQPQEAEVLKKELEQLRRDYEARIRELEERLEGLEWTAKAAASTGAPPTVAIVTGSMASTNVVERRAKSGNTESRER